MSSLCLKAVAAALLSFAVVAPRLSAGPPPRPNPPTNFSVQVERIKLSDLKNRAVLRWQHDGRNVTRFIFERERLRSDRWRGRYVSDPAIDPTARLKYDLPISARSDCETFRYRLKAVGPGGSSEWTPWIEAKIDNGRR